MEGVCEASDYSLGNGDPVVRREVSRIRGMPIQRIGVAAELNELHVVLDTIFVQGQYVLGIFATGEKDTKGSLLVVKSRSKAITINFILA